LFMNQLETFAREVDGDVLALELHLLLLEDATKGAQALEHEGPLLEEQRGDVARRVEAGLALLDGPGAVDAALPVDAHSLAEPAGREHTQEDQPGAAPHCGLHPRATARANCIVLRPSSSASRPNAFFGSSWGTRPE